MLFLTLFITTIICHSMIVCCAKPYTSKKIFFSSNKEFGIIFKEKNQYRVRNSIAIREIQFIFQLSRCKSSHVVKTSWYQSIMQFHIPKQRNLCSAAVKNNLNMPGIEKSRTCVRYVLDIINFTNFCIWLFSNK